MYSPETEMLKMPGQVSKFNFQRFELKDQPLIQRYIEKFSPLSCEYNFANLFSWQDPYQIEWAVWQGRLLIYDGLSRTSFMPLGEDLTPEELVILSLNLRQAGMGENFGLVPESYIALYPDITDYYKVNPVRDAAEYIYDVNHLVELSGTRLHKKKNLISQFKRYYPDYKVTVISQKEDIKKGLDLSSELLNRRKRKSKTLDQEFHAIKTSFEHFDKLGLEGLLLTLKDQVIAFSVFSRLNDATYDIQFEKADPDFKGAAQAVNYETAVYLKDKCRYLNREQDLGIKGLRQAKLSYDPVELLVPNELILK